MTGDASEDLAGSWFADVGPTGLAPAETSLSPKIAIRASQVHGRGTFAVAEIADRATVRRRGTAGGHSQIHLIGAAARSALTNSAADQIGR